MSPTLIDEFGLQARDLGLLAGGYFLGFALTQLPMGRWLDSLGPRKVLCALLLFAVLGSVTFSMATEFNHLLVARLLTGVGVSACLMAPLTGYRRWLTPAEIAAQYGTDTGSVQLTMSACLVGLALGQIVWGPVSDRFGRRKVILLANFGLGLDYLVIKPYSQHKFSETHQYENIDYSGYIKMAETLEKFNTAQFQVVFRENTMRKYMESEDARYSKCNATPFFWAYVMADGSVRFISDTIDYPTYCLLGDRADGAAIPDL